MQIIVNGETIQTDSATIAQLLNELGIIQKTMAAAINMEIVKKEKWNEATIKEGDKIEFLQFVGGG
jgi:sulfur carrier protein